jgi:O-antigen/teichoic acid export membrane protein
VSVGRESVANPFRGAGWVLAIRWGDRLIGVVSTLVLARLLVPAEFGTFALASIVVGFADVVLDLGVHIALLRDPQSGRTEYDAAWTLRLVQSAFAALVVSAAAYPTAAWFGEPRLAALLPWLGLALLIAAFENIGIIDFQKQQRFDRDFLFFFSKRLVGFVVTVAFAYALHSFWALAIGTLAHRCAGVLLSYSINAYRPRWSFKGGGAIWHVSKWVVAMNAGAFLEQRVDKVLLGRQAPASVVGAYAIADDVAGLPGTELFQPLNRALFPALVAQRHDPSRMKQAFMLAFGVHCMIGLPAGAGLALIAAPLVHVALGPGWEGAIPILQVLAFGALAVALSAAGRYLLLVEGRTRALASLSWLQVALFLTAVIVLGTTTAERLATLRVAAAAVAALLVLAQVTQGVAGIGWVDLIRAIARPVPATALMAACVLYVGRIVTSDVHWATLALLIVTGAFSYVASLALLWFAAGRPLGPEHFVVDSITSRCSR